jgi:hypothetical protein
MSYSEYWRIKFDPLLLTSDVIEHIARLNSWIRSPSQRDFGWASNGIERAIYYYKNKMLDTLAASEQMRVRMVYANVECRTCGGSGIYMDRCFSDESLWQEDCRTCRATGTVRLDFYESTLENGVVFHTPHMKAPCALTNLAFKTYNLADDDLSKYLKLYESAVCVTDEWQPNQIGHDLTPEQVADALNIIETAFFGSEFPTVYTIRHWSYDREFFYYQLPLGRLDARCVYCGQSAPQVKGWWHHQSDLISNWFDWRCDQDSKIHAFSPVPASVAPLREPEPIHLWLARRRNWSAEK